MPCGSHSPYRTRSSWTNSAGACAPASALNLGLRDGLDVEVALVELGDPAEVLFGEVGLRRGGGPFLELLDVGHGRQDARDRVLGEDELERCLGHRDAVLLAEESKLL